MTNVVLVYELYDLSIKFSLFIVIIFEIYIRGMRHTSTALYFYRASKKNVRKPTANL
jgi:hypothetical protein